MTFSYYHGGAPQDNGEPKDIDEEKLQKVINLIEESIARPMKLFIVGKKRWLRVYWGHVNYGSNEKEFGDIVPKNLNRGEILDSFAKIEFIINEIIDTIIFQEKISNKSFLLESLSNKVDLAQKIHILKNDWGIISQETYEMLHKLKSVRNVLAHSWDFGDAVYGEDQNLETNFPQFQQDIKEVWKRLVVVYEHIQPQNELMDFIISEFEKVKEEQKKFMEKRN